MRSTESSPMSIVENQFTEIWWLGLLFIGNFTVLMQLFSYVTNKYDVNFKLQLDYQSMFIVRYVTRQ